MCLNNPRNSDWLKKDKLIGTVGGKKWSWYITGIRKKSIWTRVFIKRMRGLHSPQRYERTWEVWRWIKRRWWVEEVESEDVTVSCFLHRSLLVTPVVVPLSASHASFQPLLFCSDNTARFHFTFYSPGRDGVIVTVVKSTQKNNQCRFLEFRLPPGGESDNFRLNGCIHSVATVHYSALVRYLTVVIDSSEVHIRECVIQGKPIHMLNLECTVQPHVHSA